MSAYENFDRQYRLAAGPSGGTGFEIGETTPSQPVPMKIEFSIQKSDLETPNTGKVSVWNLNKDHLAVLDQKKCCLTLRAGYGTRLPLIFAGVVSYATTAIDGADRKTEIEVIDNLVALRDTYVSISYRGKVNWKTIMDDVAKQIGVAVVYSYNAKFADIPNGFSFVGLAKNIMDKGCSCCGLTWSIQNGVMQVKRPGDVLSDQAFLLAPETGLIGIPAKVVISNDEETGEVTTGWDVEFFLNGAIHIDDYIKLESETVRGYFRVYSLEITGDTTGDWTEKARLLEMKPAYTATTQQSSGGSSSNGSFKAGDKVRVANGAKTYSGGSLASFVYSTVFTVIQVGGSGLPANRVVIGKNGQVTAAVRAEDLIHA